MVLTLEQLVAIIQAAYDRGHSDGYEIAWSEVEEGK